jgi:hypothetical protein
MTTRSREDVNYGPCTTGGISRCELVEGMSLSSPTQWRITGLVESSPSFAATGGKFEP